MIVGLRGYLMLVRKMLLTGGQKVKRKMHYDNTLRRLAPVLSQVK
jgi:hypothetical protein